MKSSNIKQRKIIINGIPILFPFEPYENQIQYMSKVIETLNKESSALLESPTGTGKTLSLLCSILAWRENLKTSQRNKNIKNAAIPTIIYSTRTHSQLDQCVQELKRTAYNPIISILGSRKQLCVHPDISLYAGSIQNAKCRAMNATTSIQKCSFKSRSKLMKKKQKIHLSQRILDIEDLHLIGKDQGFCPYYYSIDNCKQADIIFMPYNYLVNESIKPPTLDLNDSIVIFDEAHNIESICCDSRSFELKYDVLSQSITEVEQILEWNDSINERDLHMLKNILFKLQYVIENLPISKSLCTHEGSYILDILQQATITKKNKDIIIDICQDVLRELILPETKQNLSRISGKYGIEIFSRALQNIYNSDFDSDSFRVQISIKSEQRCLNLWCFNPSLAIEGLKKQCHALILTSGTLSPLQSFSSELQISFPIRLQNKHLIGSDQVYVGILERGPNSRVLSSEYNIRSDENYLRELGNTLIFISRRIPSGMLVFFASYKHMNDCVEYWHRYHLGECSYMEHFQNNKEVVIELPGGQKNVKFIFEQYCNSLKTKKGAMMFAVMRGKVSEGMDFSDNCARCVVICGIPYNNIKDPKIKEKINYMDKKSWNQNRNKGNGFGSISGKLWYQQQAIRAVNQAIGRVIRHKFDYGAVILADRRFNWKRNQEYISEWIQPYIKTPQNFGSLTRDLTSFFNQAKKFDKYLKNKKI